MEITLDSLTLSQGQIGWTDNICETHGERMFKCPTGEEICEKCEEERKRKLLDDDLQQQRRKWHEKAVSEAREGLNLPARLERYSFKDFTATSVGQKKALEICLNFVRLWPDVGGGLMLIGGVGTGKTHLAVCICKELAEKAVRCQIATIFEIIRNIKATWSGLATDEWGDKITEQGVIDGFSSVPLLVIDEIGAQYGSESELIFITEIINNRYQAMLPTIAIGNVKRSEMEKLIGARAVDRILHGGHQIVFDWPSERVKTGGL